MRLIKNHLSIILPLITLLLSLQSYILVDRVVSSYQSKLSSDYSVVVVSSTQLTENIFSDNIPQYKSYEEITIDDVLDSMKDGISQANLALLKVSIPKFYQIKLSTFPTTSEIQTIQTSLKANPNVLRIETFSKSHDNIYDMLLLSKGIVSFFAFLLIVVSIFLIVKQVEVWHYQHSNRLYILSLLGASFIMKSKSLFKTAIVNSIISAILVSSFFYYITSKQNELEYLKDIKMMELRFIPQLDIPVLFGVSISVSIFILLIVLLRQRD